MSSLISLHLLVTCLNFERIILLLMAFVILMKASTAIKFQVFNNHILWDSKAVTGGFLEKKLFLKIMQYSQVLDSFVNEVSDLRGCNFVKKDTPTQVFSSEYCEFLRTIILRNIYRWMLLETSKYLSIRQSELKLQFQP